jgi:hypothetical protein
MHQCQKPSASALPACLAQVVKHVFVVFGIEHIAIAVRKASAVSLA